MGKKHLTISVKVPGRVQDVGKALKRLGGVTHLAHTVTKVHRTLLKAQTIALKETSKRSKTKEDDDELGQVLDDVKEQAVCKSRNFMS